jgi:hypothetical protein
MSLSSYDKKLFSPLGNGLKGYFYDFETMYTCVDKYPWKPSNEQGNNSPKIIFPDRVTNYIHETIHFYQHVGTTFGQFQAICRHNRLRHSISGIERADKNKLYNRAFPKNKLRQPLLTRNEIPSLSNYESDPFSPNNRHSFRLMWYRILAGEKAMLMASSLRNIDKEYKVNLYTSLSSASIFWNYQLGNEISTSLVSSIFERGIQFVRYLEGKFVQHINTIHLIENLCSVWEICFLNNLESELAKVRMTNANKNNYLLVSRFLLWNMGKDFLPYNVSKFTPEISLITELALNPPITELGTKEITWEQIYPPLRLGLLANASKKIGAYLELGNHDSETLKKRAELLIEEANIPYKHVSETPPPISSYSSVKEMMSEEVKNLNGGLKEGESSWIKWYLWFQSLYIEKYESNIFITDMIFNCLMKNGSWDWEPPLILETQKGLLISNYLEKNHSGAMLFQWENLRSGLSYKLFHT